MAIVVIKIGENEPPTYPRYQEISHYGDIINIHPDGTTIGTQTVKHYLLLYVDTSGISKQEYNEWREQIMEKWIAGEETAAKRVCRLDFESATFISADDIIALDEAAAIKNAIKPAVYQYVADYKASHLGAAPPGEEVALYQKQLSDNFDMGAINSEHKDVVIRSDFNDAIYDKRSGSLLSG